MTIAFSKFHGAGNDFIIVDGHEVSFPVNDNELVRKMCDRHFGIGADGLMLLLPEKGYDFRMLYYNSDGYKGTMCGNGGRCITAFARNKGYVINKATFMASDGSHESQINADGTISLKMSDVAGISDLGDGLLIDTGSLHFIVETKNPHEIDVFTRGKEIRNQSRFQPGGVNVNFVEYRDSIIYISTFERGVEAETLACGTGSVAAAIAIKHKFNLELTEISLIAKGGVLKVSYKERDGKYSSIWLNGPVENTFVGEYKY